MGRVIAGSHGIDRANTGGTPGHRSPGNRPDIIGVGRQFGDHGNIDPLREFYGCVDVDALQKPIAANVGEQKRGNARVLEPTREVDHGDVGHFRPALGRDHAVFRVNRDDDAVLPFARHVFDEFGVFQGSRTHNNARHAKVEPAFHRLCITNAAAQLHIAGKLLDNCLDRFDIAAFPGKAAVQIDDMQMLCSGVCKDHRLRRRIVTINRRAVHIALCQSHNFASLEINCGKNNHFGSQLKNRSSIATP